LGVRAVRQDRDNVGNGKVPFLDFLVLGGAYALVLKQLDSALIHENISLHVILFHQVLTVRLSHQVVSLKAACHFSLRDEKTRQENPIALWYTKLPSGYWRI
jgi:hypothetical protein